MSVPRFTDEHLIPLKRVMLARQPDFAYTSADVDALVQETGLLRSQIQKWAGHFRERTASRKLDDVMANLRGHKAVSDSLCFLSNVTSPKIGFASGPKSWTLFLIFLSISGWTRESQEIFRVLLRRDP